MTRAGRALFTALLAAPALLVERSAAAQDSPPAGAKLTRAQVVARLEAATEQKPADFKGADLSALDLSGLDFKQANLTEARLLGTNLSRAQMFGVTLNQAVAQDANFSSANLDVAVMRGTDLTRANLRDASLYATILIGANLTEADLGNARIIAALTDATLTRAKLRDTRMGADPGNQPMGIMRTDLTGSNLTGADLTGADLRKAVLVRADLSDADVTGADMSGTDLRSIRGRDKIRGLDRAKNVDKAMFDTPPAMPHQEPAAEKPVTDKLVATEEEYQGWRYYHLYCSRCHGEDVLGSAQAPDLRKSVSTGISADSFFVLVRDGSTENKEMKGFRDVLDDFRIRQIHAYVMARTEGRLAMGRPHRATPPPN